MFGRFLRSIVRSLGRADSGRRPSGGRRDLLEHAVGPIRSDNLTDARRPEEAEALHELARIAQKQDRFDEAVGYLERALTVAPNAVSVHITYGNVRRARGELDLAARLYSRALEVDADCVEAYLNLGMVSCERGELQQGIALLEKATRMNPDLFVAHHNLGNALRAQGRFEAAATSYQRALQVEPEAGDTHFALGLSFQALGKHDVALPAYHRAVESGVNDPELHYRMGNLLYETGRLHDARNCLERTINSRPDMAEAHNGMATILLATGELEGAVREFRRAVQLKPSFAEAYNNLGMALLRGGEFDSARTAFRQALDIKPDFAEAHSNLIYALNFSPAYTPEEIFAEHVEWARSHAAALGTESRPRGDPLDPARRLRVGYVSPNFRDHAVAYFFEPALRHHDRKQFSIYLYSDVRQPDALTARLRSYGDEWRDIAGLSDAAVADLVRGDRIDLLVDLTGHTNGHRLLAFARKPAPLQITWNGYPNTTGMQAMDYRITDGYADPPGMTERWHSEQLLRMPEIYMPFEPPAESPAVNAPPVQANGYITFGSFNNLTKITPQVIELWSRILHSVAGSRLLMLTVPEGRTRLNIVHAFAEHGISEARLKLVGRLPVGAFLAAHREADVALDPFPYNGTTTTCHSLWMGVPVITLAGASHAARVGVSILSNLGLQRLVARDAAEYVAIATALADAPADLAALRAGLRERMLRSPNTDGERYTRFLETAYRNIWRDWCSAPVH